MGHINLTQGKTTFVDDEDLEILNRHRWCVVRIHNNFYAQAHIGGKRCYMHRLLMGLPDGLEVDHINGDGLDNRRCNLRLATHQQNLANQRTQVRNKAGFRGVSQNKRSQKPWRARIKCHGKEVHLGHFDSAEDAARAYDRAAIDTFGDFARTNFPGDMNR